MGLRSANFYYWPDPTVALVALIDFLHSFKPFECGGVILLKLIDGIVSASYGWDGKRGKSDNTQGRNGARKKA